MPAAVDRPPLVLASSSPRRRELLAGLGLAFETLPADVDETPLPGEAPSALVERLSAAKAEAVAALRPEALVLAADTVVALGAETLGKPADAAENERFLSLLAGRSHDVYTGHCLRLRGRQAARVVRTEVWFRSLEQREVRAYVASGEGLDKAGGYGIQGLGATLVPRLEGCYFSVVGLSLAAVAVLARDLGVELV